MSPADRHEELFSSQHSTGVLLALALTVKTVPDRSELFGRSHAWYSIAHTQVAAIIFVADQLNDFGRRNVACQALARAGYGLDNLPEVAT